MDETRQILLTSIFSRLMKENIVLLTGNTLLLFESKESARPACISARRVTCKPQLTLENGMRWTRDGVRGGRTARVKY